MGHQETEAIVVDQKENGKSLVRRKPERGSEMQEIKKTVSKTPIEIALQVDAKGRTTARKLYEFLNLDRSQFARWAKTNIEKNEFFEEGVDWEAFDIVSYGNPCKDYKLTAEFAKHLSMESHSARGREARDYFLKVEDKMKEVVVGYENLPPELQMFKQLFDQQTKQFFEIQRMKEENTRIEKKVDSIKEVVAMSAKDWREDTSKMVKKIAQLKGNAYSEIRSESYEALTKRFGVDLKIRLTNKRRRMADEGVSKTTRDKLSYLDVIADDKKLIEGYVAIVKEMAIKYGVDAN